jgi:hypothetical protein
MRSRLATYMSLGRHILVSTLLAVIVTAAAGAKCSCRQFDRSAKSD